MTAGRRLAPGLTLLEMMVALLIASMALALGYQSLAQWRLAETAISGQNGNLRKERLGQQWFESSLRGLIPVETKPFSGDSRQLTGITSRPVLASQGGMSSLMWKIQDGSNSLLLEEDGQTVTLDLPLGTNTHFIYFDREGKEHSQWPPKLGLASHLPSAIALAQESTSATDRSVYWMAAVAGKLNPIEILMYEPESD